MPTGSAWTSRTCLGSRRRITRLRRAPQPVVAPERRYRQAGVCADALGAGSVLGKGRQNRVHDHQCARRRGIGKARLPGGAEEPALPDPSGRVLRVAACRWEDQAAVCLRLQSGEPYSFAGLWERWKPKEGEPLESFTILTTDPNELAEKVHDRMPVILEPRDYARWIEPGDPARPPIDLLRPYPAEKMRSWAVDQRVGNVRNDDPELLSVQPAQQLLF